MKNYQYVAVYVPIVWAVLQPPAESQASIIPPWKSELGMIQDAASSSTVAILGYAPAMPYGPTYQITF